MRTSLLALLLLLVACEQGADRGAVCRRDTECRSPLVCALGHCRAECRESRDCEAGARCLIEPSTGVSVCSVGAIDACATTECPLGFVCQAGECLNACEAIVRCADSVCIDGVCVPNRDDAGVPNDAGTDARAEAGADAGPECHGPGCDPVIDVTVGRQRTFVVTASGAVWAWGDSSDRALGDGLIAHGACADCSPTPVQALLPGGAPFDDAVEVSAGEAFACGRRSDGTVWCWGYDGEGQLGDGAPAATGMPAQVVMSDGATTTPVTDAVAIASGRSHSCMIRGALRETWCWGLGNSGELGTGLVANSGVAVRATAFPAPTEELAMGYRHTFARSADGTVRGVGRNDCTVLGAGGPDEVVVVAISPSVGAAVSIATSTWNACALSSTGSVGCWGIASPVLGGAVTFPACTGCGATADSCTAMAQPIVLPSMPPFDRIVGSGDGIYFGLTANAAYVWGGAFGAVLESQPVPIPISLPGGPRVVDAAGGGHACLVTLPGDVYCFGANGQGELGRGTTSTSDSRLLPVVWP